MNLMSPSSWVHPMNLIQKHKLKPILLTVLSLTILWVIPTPTINTFSVHKAVLGTQTVSATTHYGILGQIAPELDLNTWIDGNGIEIEPIMLNDYRGKVVYLYLFQNW